MPFPIALTGCFFQQHHSVQSDASPEIVSQEDETSAPEEIFEE